MDGTNPPATAHDRRLATALGAALVGLAAFAYALAAFFDFTLNPSQTLDPHRSGFATAGGFAAALCIIAMWRLRKVSRGRTRWVDAALWFTLAVVALLVLVVVTFASRLGG